jgi:hypothetical protein
MRIATPLFISVAALGLLAWALWPDPDPAGTNSASAQIGTDERAVRVPGADAADHDRARLRADPRIDELIYGGARTGWYDRDVSDTLPILIEKLERGMVEPLQRAKEELAAGGDAALVEVERVLRRNFSDRMATGPFQNALDVACMSEGLLAHDLLVLCLDHARAAVRTAAADALGRRHGRPEDYDRFLLQLEGERPEVRLPLMRALLRADPARASRQYLEWACSRKRGELSDVMVPVLMAITDPEACARARSCWREALIAVRAALAVPAARGGDMEAEAYLDSDLRSPEMARRGQALLAQIALERWDRVGELLMNEGDPSLRKVALNGLAGAVSEPRARSWIEQVGREPAVASASGDLSEAALGLLLRLGDRSAEDRVLADLDGEGPPRERALRLLMPLLPERPDLTERTWQALLRRAELERALPPDQKLALFQSIGLVPRAQAARYLREFALELPESTPLKGKRAHEWLMIQASNTGVEGRAWLAEQLASERDPLRRIDLLWAVSAQRCADAGPCIGRDALLAVLDDPATAPLEMLFVAGRLVQLGPAQQIAPRLKRAVLRISDPEARLAFETLLWTWY